MIEGNFGDKGELFFEIDLIAADSSIITVDALLDTGFTDWLAMALQDVEGLGWSFIEQDKRQTANLQSKSTHRLITLITSPGVAVAAGSLHSVTSAKPKR